MDLTNNLFGLISFAVNSALFSGMLIPQVQRLKEVKDQLIKFRITHVPVEGIRPLDKRELSVTQDQQVTQLHLLFDTYRIRAGELRKTTWFYLVAVGIVALMIVGTFVFDPKWTTTIVLIATILQYATLFWAILSYTVGPNRLQEADYLVRELSFNPHELINAMNLRLSLQSVRWMERPFKDTDPLIIELTTDLRVYGYSYIYLVTNVKKTKLFYVSLGKVRANSGNVIRQLLPTESFKVPSGEANEVQLGRFQFNLVKERPLLGTLLLFIPFFGHESNSPLVADHAISTEHLTVMAGGTWPLSTTRLQTDIEYRGVGIKLTDVKSDSENKIIKGVVDRLGGKLKKARFTKEWSDVSGKLLTRL